MEEKIVRAVTRPHKLRVGKYKVFTHSVYVRSVAFAVSMETEISDFHMLCGHLYGELRDSQVRASITQAAIRDGVSAVNAYRTATKNAAGGKPPSEPEFDRPVVKLNNYELEAQLYSRGLHCKGQHWLARIAAPHNDQRAAQRRQEG